MSNFFKQNRENIFVFIFFLLSSVIYFWPFLQFPAFNLIDDGTSIKVSKEFISGNFEYLIESQNGRVRPLYWMYFTTIYFFSGINPLGFWISQTLVFSLTLFSIWYLLANNLNKTKWPPYLIALSSLVFYFIPEISENLFRLGTAEVRQMLLIIWFVIWMKNQTKKNSKNWIGFLLFLASLFSKETSILLLPMILIYMLPHIITNFKTHKNKICSLLFLSFVSIIFYSFLSALKETQSYSSSFNISFEQIKLNLLISRLGVNEIYYLIFIITTLFIIRLYFKLVEKNVFNSKKENYIFKVLLEFWKENSLEISIVVGLFTSLFFVFSWEHQLGRYYYPVYIFLFIYLIIELKKTIKIFTETKRFKHKIILILLPLFILPLLYLTVFQKTAPNLNKYIAYNQQIKKLWYSDYQNSYSIIKILMSEDLDTMYTLIDDYEVVYELGFFANKADFNFHKIETISTNMDISSKYNYFTYSSDIKNDFEKDKSKAAILLTTESKNLDLDKSIYKQEVISNDFLKKHSQRPSWVIWRKI